MNVPEITHDRLRTLMGSARANMQASQVEIYHYEGAIQTLQLLIDDLRAQEIKEQHEPIEVEEGPGYIVQDSDAEGDE
jgi:hypothetical protein